MGLTAFHQLWQADITCLRLRNEFVFLAVIQHSCPSGGIGVEADQLEGRSREFRS